MKRIVSFSLLFVLVLALLCGCSSQDDTVMKIGETEISAMEYNYTYYTQVQNFYNSYGDYLSYFKIDPEKPLKEQPCTVTETEQSWAEFFMDQTDDILQQVFCFYNAAVAEGMELSEEYRLQVDAFVLSATEVAALESRSLDDYLSEYYGEGLNEAKYREFLSRRFLASQYCDEKLSAIDHSDADFEAYYAKNADAMDLVDFRYYTITAEYLPADSSAATEPDVEAAVKALADSFAENLTSEEEFKRRAVEFAPAKLKESYESDNATLAADIASSRLTGTVSAWLFDQSRKTGDVLVQKTATETYSIYYFISRHRDERPMASMRHLLLSVTTNEDGSSDDAQVYEKIQGLYAQWQSSSYSESVFVDLVAKNSTDSGSKDTGGLYENFTSGTMVSEIDRWLFGETRTSNDTAIIKTTYGYHIVWFLSYGEISWKYQCLPGLQDEDYYALLEGLKESNPVTFRADYRDVVGNNE